MGVPTLVVGGTGSGTGKTTVVCALACGLAERGVDVRLFKAGPDYLDPTFHQAATGRPSRNLDAWMTGVDGVARAFTAGTQDLGPNAIALVEGVMGLFDGRSPTSLEGSGAQLAMLLGAPVALVVDASGAARSAVPVVEGFANHAPHVHVRGVLWNRVGSRRHAQIIEEAMAASPADVRTLGGLPRNDQLFLPSRHLGLMAAHVSSATATKEARIAWRAALAAWAREYVDLDAVLALAQGAQGLGATPAALPHIADVRIGLAMDDAFHFYYPDNLDLLRASGAELVPFSPLADTALPDVDGLIVGGGYPEEHAAQLAANRPMREQIRAFARSGRPVYGECGGLMYLGSALVDGDGHSHEMVGALPLVTRMGARLRSLGYREVTTRRDTVLGPAGTTFRGHEFHYSELTDAGDCPAAFQWTGRRGEGSCGYVADNVVASYIHAHWGSNPRVPRAFVQACSEAA